MTSHTRPMRLGWTAAALAGLSLHLVGCATATETQPYRTATEQLLVTEAADAAAKQLKLPIPPGRRVYLDTVNFKGEGSDYAISALREALVRQGVVLALDRHACDVVLEVRLGALSIDQMNRVLGVPTLTLPIITASLTTVTIPELSVYSRRDRTGVAEFLAFAYDAQTGKEIGAPIRLVGETQLRSHKLMMVMSWGQQELRPTKPAPTAPEEWWRVW